MREWKEVRKQKRKFTYYKIYKRNYIVCWWRRKKYFFLNVCKIYEIYVFTCVELQRLGIL